MWKQIGFGLLVYLTWGFQLSGYETNVFVLGAFQIVVTLCCWAIVVFPGSLAIAWAAVVGLTADLFGSGPLGATMLITTSAAYCAILAGRTFRTPQWARIILLTLIVTVTIHSSERLLSLAGKSSLPLVNFWTVELGRQIWSSSLIAILGCFVAGFCLRVLPGTSSGRSETAMRRWTMLAD